ncbi:hypothetical protein YC2023_104141 [Brassica napus]
MATILSKFSPYNSDEDNRVSVNKVTKKPPEASPSVVFRSYHAVAGSSSSERLDVAEEGNSSVDLPLSPSPSSVEVREVTLDDCSSGVEVDGGDGNHGQFVVPSLGSESDESSYMSDEDSLAAAPRAERRGKRGSCYPCLMGNRFTEKEVCVAKYCSSCVRRAMGSMPEGRKCLPCIGLRISESNRKSLGKCSRMLKRLLAGSELRKVMHDEVTCKANQLYARLIYVNGWPLSENELDKLQTCPNPPKKLKPGDYWYDKVSGYWGKVGEKPCQIISPHMNIGASAIIEQASNGDTEIFINNQDRAHDAQGKPHFWVDADGRYQEEGQNRIIGRIWNKKRARFSCAVLSLPFPPTSSAETHI